MITAFLSLEKILDNPDIVNWREFYIKIFFRIAPLYLVAVGISVAYIIITIKVPFIFFPYISGVFYWLTFF